MLLSTLEVELAMLVLFLLNLLSWFAAREARLRFGINVMLLGKPATGGTSAIECCLICELTRSTRIVFDDALPISLFFACEFSFKRMFADAWRSSIKSIYLTLAMLPLIEFLAY